MACTAAINTTEALSNGLLLNDILTWFIIYNFIKIGLCLKSLHLKACLTFFRN